MYMPFAYNTEDLAGRNREQMLNILRTVDSKYCQCPYGAAGKEVGYACPGTCLDWVYEALKTPYAFALEIYTSPQYAYGLRERWQRKLQQNTTALLQQQLADERFADLFSAHPSDFVQRRDNSLNDEEFIDTLQPQECFAIFNPTSEAEYWKTVPVWVESYLDTAALVAADLRRSNHGNASASR
eukprot:TRINITY_DN11569_c0_g1_i2.p2 TRINITY_DN11569_c0_g1~~TRINITY_DN11569_c0_g1_i2.p2  ORF type:complete len:184 (-),score=42.59 TRINITY_DN11569_c0_g1_i2:17-568(-)